MNIFFLDKEPKKAAYQQCDKHVVKMILESAQLLCTAHRLIDGKEIIGKSPSGRKQKQYVLDDERDVLLYKATHPNHPSAIWARQSLGNYNWLYEHFIGLCEEYTSRYGKVHLTETKLAEVLKRPPNNIPKIGMTSPALAMPDEYKVEDPIQSYKNYYKSKVNNIKMTWKKNKPEWFNAKLCF